MKIKGAFAVRWAAQDGNGIKSITEHYLATSAGSGVTTSTSGWTAAVQATTATNKYLWNYEVILYTNGGSVTTSPHIIGTHGETGATGNGIKSIAEYYQVSSSNTTAPTSWATTPPVMTSTNKYLWNYEVVTYTDGTTASTAKRVIGTYGDKGDTGAQGRDGITWRTSEWLPETEYHNDTASGSDPRYVDIVVFTDEGRTEISAAYQCRQTHTASDASKPGSGASWQTYWQKVSNMQGGLVTPFIISEAAFIENLTVGGIVSYDSAGNIVFKAKDGEVTCNTGTFKNITVDGTSVFKGSLSGVTGSFKSLNCVNDSGTVVANISFGSDGRMWFQNGDLYHQGTKEGRNLRFYMSDVWCRGVFGARERSTVYIHGTTAYYYVNGYGTSASNYVSKTLTSATDSAGHTYYTVYCYGSSSSPTDGTAGFPVDTVVIKQLTSVARYYVFVMAALQRITVINANDDMNNIYLCTHTGAWTQLGGGCTRQLMYVPWLYPETDTTLGKNIMVTSTNDFNW